MTAPATALAGTGRGVILPAGTYEWVHMDGAAEGVAYIKGPEGLCAVSMCDSNIQFQFAAAGNRPAPQTLTGFAGAVFHALAEQVHHGFPVAELPRKPAVLPAVVSYAPERRVAFPSMPRRKAR